VLTTLDQYDGISLDPTGSTIFAADGQGIDILDRSGTRTQRISQTAGGGQTDGVAFHTNGNYVVSNNHDGTITRLDFPGSDYSQPPTQTLLASGGFRGDMVQVGPDSCLYVTQDGARYGDGTVTSEQSIVRICAGFVPPTSPQPPSHAPGKNPSSDCPPRRSTSTLPGQSPQSDKHPGHR
jgi:hypothetical protein